MFKGTRVAVMSLSIYTNTKVCGVIMLHWNTYVLTIKSYEQVLEKEKKQDHRIIQFGGNLRRSLVQPLLREGPVLRSEQVAQGFIPLGLENPQVDGDCTASPGSLFHH